MPSNATGCADGAVVVDPAGGHEFPAEVSVYRWRGKHHGKATEVWIAIHKVGSGLKSIKLKKGGRWDRAHRTTRI